MAHLSEDIAFSAKGKTALITGAGSGIGAAIARELTRAGAQVILADINLEAAKKVAAELEGSRSFEMDVTSADSIAHVAGQLSSLDILVNNAGIGLVGGIETTSFEDFSRIMHVNVDSVFLVTKALLPLLLKTRGSIINIGSVAGLVGIKQRFAYCASKGAVVAMTRQMSVEYPKQLRVNCICPGTVDSPFVAGYLAKYHAGEEDQVREQLKARQPVGRLAQPEEIASLVRYLCSPEADFMHGSVLTIDGGWTAA
jgi:NAD(P)-dependent dehydrogenase (short-subunit alcohol dehydrogenase family)